MAQRRTFLPSRQSSRPNRSWSSSVQAAPTTVAAATKVLMGSLILSNTNIDETILRVVGQLAVKTDQLSASEDQIGAFGMIVVSSRALTAGAASIPGPFSDGADDWFVYVPIGQSFGFGSASAFDSQHATRYMIDSKAKRVVTEGRGIAIMVENGHASAGFQAFRSIRMLGMVRGTR